MTESKQTTTNSQKASCQQTTQKNDISIQQQNKISYGSSELVQQQQQVAYNLDPGVEYKDGYYHNEYGYWNQMYFYPYQQTYERFGGLFQWLDQMFNTPNPKWTNQERALYNNYIFNIRDYIEKYIYTGYIHTNEDYLRIKNQYDQNNKAGFQLFTKQQSYILIRQGYQTKQKGEKVVKIYQPQKKKEVVQARINDVQVNIKEMQQTQWAPQKYLNIQKLKKPNLNLIFIGHVDSGKSTLTGNLLRELNEVDEQDWISNKQDAKNNRMTSWELAGVSDVIPAERIDGKTRECAKLTFALSTKRFTLFDAPGHKNYVPNMMMGACQSDAAILIVSAKEGEYESGFEKEGQTKEHAMLAKALGVYELGVVVTKMGTVAWDQKRYNLIRNQVAPFLQNACGFKNVTFVPVDSIDNLNIHSPHSIPWYKGPTLIQFLDQIKVPERTPEKPLRIPVIDKFKDVGILYIYGKIESGKIKEDLEVSLLPSRKRFFIKEIFNAKDERMPFAIAGENVKIRVKGIEEDDIERGDIVCNNQNYCQQSSEFKANLTVLQLPEKNKILSSGFNCVIHMHAISAQISIDKVDSKYDAELKKHVAATFLRSGEIGNVVIKIGKPLCMEKFDFMPSLGRFTLRDGNKTIGFGEVLKLKPAKILEKEQRDQLLISKKAESSKTEISNCLEQQTKDTTTKENAEEEIKQAATTTQ